MAGVEDKELTEAMEQVLNQGSNGKNLHDHLKLTTPNGEALGVDYKELNRVGSEEPDLTDKARQTVMGDLDDGRDRRCPDGILPGKF